MSDDLTFGTIKSQTEDGLMYFLFAMKGEPREPDFRKGKWGDSMAECKRKESKADTFHMDDIYAFKTHVAGLSTIAAYRFTNDKLTSGKYIFQNQNTDNCIENYNELVSFLTKKYGEPINVEKEDIAKDYERSVYSEGQLVQDGKLKFETTWYTPFSLITIFLNAERYSISLTIEYYSNRLNQMREDSILEDL